MADEQTSPATPGGTNFVIRELTGDQRTIELVGRALPYRPIVFRGTQAVDKTWNGGNPVATMQVGGPQEDPSDFTGWWKDRFIKAFTPEGVAVQPDGAINLNGSPVATVKDGVDLLDDVRRKGQLLEVAWAHIVRRGVLESFEQKWHRVQDVEWAMHFEWQGQGEPDVPSVVSGRTSISDLASDMDTAVKAVQAAASPPDNLALDGDVLGQLQAGIAKLASDVDDLQAAVEAGIDAVSTPFDIARQVAAVLAGVVGHCDDILEQFWSTPPGLLLQAGLTDPSSLSSGEVLATDLYVSDLLVAVKGVQQLAVEQQQNVNQDTDPDLLDVFFAQAGTDLRYVSLSYYGTMDQWRDLAWYNDIDMSGSELEQGHIVYVPTLQVLQNPMASPPDPTTTGAA